jgi:hypothetical protein
MVPGPPPTFGTGTESTSKSRSEPSAVSTRLSSRDGLLCASMVVCVRNELNSRLLIWMARRRPALSSVQRRKELLCAAVGQGNVVAGVRQEHGIRQRVHDGGEQVAVA